MYGLWWPSHKKWNDLQIILVYDMVLTASHHQKQTKRPSPSNHSTHFLTKNPRGSLDTWPASAQLCRQLFVQSWRLAWTQMPHILKKGREREQKNPPKWSNVSRNWRSIIRKIVIFAWLRYNELNELEQTKGVEERAFEWWDLAVFEKNAGSFEEKVSPKSWLC